MEIKYLSTHNKSRHSTEEFLVMALLSLAYKKLGYKVEIILSSEGNLPLVVERFRADSKTIEESREDANTRNHDMPHGLLGKTWQYCGKTLSTTDAVVKAFNERHIQPFESLKYDPNLNILHCWTELSNQSTSENRREFAERVHVIEAAYAEIIKKLEREYAPRIVVLDEPGLVDPTISSNPNLEFVIYPSNNNRTTWAVRALKKLFPTLWRSADSDKLKKLTGAEDAFSCQDSGKFAKAKSKEGALKIAAAAMVAA